MAEAAAEALAQARVEHALADVAERRVAEVVPEPDRLGQVLVEPERPGDGARDPARLERVGQAGAVVVALGRDEDLRLVLEAPERLRVDDPVAVALERRAQRESASGAARRPGTSGGERRERGRLPAGSAAKEVATGMPPIVARAPAATAVCPRRRARVVRRSPPARPRAIGTRYGEQLT